MSFCIFVFHLSKHNYLNTKVQFNRGALNLQSLSHSDNVLDLKMEEDDDSLITLSQRYSRV